MPSGAEADGVEMIPVKTRKGSRLSQQRAFRLRPVLERPASRARASKIALAIASIHASEVDPHRADSKHDVPEGASTSSHGHAAFKCRSVTTDRRSTFQFGPDGQKLGTISGFRVERTLGVFAVRGDGTVGKTSAIGDYLPELLSYLFAPSIIVTATKVQMDPNPTVERTFANAAKTRLSGIAATSRADELISALENHRGKEIGKGELIKKKGIQN